MNKTGNLVKISLFLSTVLTLFVLFASVANGTEKMVIGFAQDTLANDWRRAQVMEVAAELKKYPDVKFIYTDGQAKTAKQISDIENLAAQGVDLLITSPRDQEAFSPVLKKVIEQGIPVVLLTRQVRGDHHTIFIHPDDRLIGRQAAAFIAEKLQGKGNIFVLQGIPGASTVIARTKGFMDEISRHAGLEVVAMKSANYLRTDAVRVTDELLRQGVKFDAIFAQSDSMAVGALIVLKKAGIDPGSIVIVGIDYINDSRQAIRKGEQAGSFRYPTCGKEGATYAMKILHGEKAPKELIVPSLLVTPENVEKIEPVF